MEVGHSPVWVGETGRRGGRVSARVRRAEQESEIRGEGGGSVTTICSRVEAGHVVVYQPVSSGEMASIPPIEPTSSVTMMEVSEH